jgi:UDP-N-acetylglucosamine diphosphorylase/glucosamine-1-phosphate N-acetyltransferase
MRLVIFEDNFYSDLLPLVYFRPVWELRCGAFTLLERLQNFFPQQKIKFITRQYLENFYLQKGSIHNSTEKQDSLYVNGRLLLSEKDRDKLLDLNNNDALIKDNKVIAFRSDKDISKFITNHVIDTGLILNEFDSIESDSIMIDYPWDLIYKNGEQIVDDFVHIFSDKIDKQSDNGVYYLNRENIFIAKSTKIMPGVVLNAEKGPIIIGDKVFVMPNSVLEGPLVIGSESIIKAGAKIYGNTTVGPVSKIGGEIEESIIQGYTNKQHDGFLGHSYLGEWINIGADTNNSDLKNNYGEISVYLNNKKINTGKRFLGLIMGDHSKTAINTMFNTGTIVGVNSNIFGEGFLPKYIPSFLWGGGSNFQEYDFNKAIDVAQVVMSRRGLVFSDKYYEIFTAVKKLSLENENRDGIPM